MKLLARSVSFFLDFFLPKRQSVVSLESLRPDELMSTLPQAQVEEGRDLVALFDYSHPTVREMVWQVKYSGNRRVADLLGTVLYDVLCHELAEKALHGKWGNSVLVPVPISDKRRFERGWNQAELLAKAIKKHDAVGQFKYLPGQLVKFRHTESQTKTANKRERLENIKNSMRILNPERVAGKCVILIDDVSTTGATLNEAKRALKEAGVKKILCVAVAH